MKQLHRTLRVKTKSLMAMSLLTFASISYAGSDHIPHHLFDTPPAEHSGLTVTGKHELKLGEQIPALEGYQVRVRTVTMEPGGIVKNHGHNTRPGAFYLIKGHITEIRGDKKIKVNPGQVVIEDHDTEHWVINNSKEDAVLFVLDVVPVE